MSVPYEMPPAVGLQATGGEPVCFALDFASRAMISKIICLQTGGTAASFTLALFNSAQACEGTAQSESIEQGAGLVPADLHRVTPDLSSDTPGSLMYFSDKSPGGHAFTFVGMDADRLGKSRKVYVRLTPQGSGPMEFAIAIGGEAFGS